MYFDRFDVVAAYFFALAHCHEGQSSEKYQRLCKLLRYFTPSSLMTVDNLNENASEIYERKVMEWTA